MRHLCADLDVKSVLSIKDRMKEGGSILLFLEGNRTYAEFQFYIPDSTPRLIKMLKPTLVLFTLHGGTGVSPRFKNKNRKGKFYGKIERVLPFEEYKDMDNDELLKLIKNTIKVFDISLLKIPPVNKTIKSKFLVITFEMQIFSVFHRQIAISTAN